LYDDLSEYSASLIAQQLPKSGKAAPNCPQTGWSIKLLRTPALYHQAKKVESLAKKGTKI